MAALIAISSSEMTNYLFSPFFSESDAGPLTVRTQFALNWVVQLNFADLSDSVRLAESSLRANLQARPDG